MGGGLIIQGDATEHRFLVLHARDAVAVIPPNAPNIMQQATPLALAAICGVLCERSGVVNIALEGIMLTGAFVGYGVAFLTHNLWLGLIAAIFAGMLIASIHAILAISFFVDQPSCANLSARKSSNSGCVGCSPSTPKLSTDPTMPRPKR